jgi:hypothetical protein
LKATLIFVRATLGGNLYLPKATFADFCGLFALRSSFAASVANMPHPGKSVRLAEKMPNSWPNDTVYRPRNANCADGESADASVLIVPFGAAGL